MHQAVRDVESVKDAGEGENAEDKRQAGGESIGSDLDQAPEPEPGQKERRVNSIGVTGVTESEGKQ